MAAEVIVDALSWACLLAGGFFSVVGGIGLIRMPDFYTRMHAASVTDTLGMGFLIIGMMLQDGGSLVSAKLLIIAILLLFTGPVATHALARAALHRGVKPLLAGPKENTPSKP
jgi:multicomponent Na+:H+ antiporter subunit G